MRSFCLHNFSFWSVFSAQRPECPSVLFRALYIHTHSYSFGIAACGHHDWLNLPLVAKHGDSSHSEPVRGEVKVLVAQCPTLCNPMDCSWPGSSATEFSRQEYWSGLLPCPLLPFPSPGDLPHPGVKPRSPALQADSLPSELPRKPKVIG